ncbi:MAG: arylesterase [Aquabacterium sp.]|nr:arylesterase [Aquabacterium sp.]
MKYRQLDFKRRSLVLGTTAALLYAKQAISAGSSLSILVLGDSLSAEYGLARGTGWVALLEARLADHTMQAKVINASISGETTAGGRTRLVALLKTHQPTHVIVELGANDALRGLSIKSSSEALQAMISSIQRTGAKVVLVGMMVPPNYGRQYAENFANMFNQLARTNKTALVPFFLKGIADRPDARDWFQADGIHPLAKGHPIMLDQVWAALKPLLLGQQARA